MTAPLFHCVVPGKPVPQGRARTTRFGTFYPKTSKAWRKVLVASFVPRVTMKLIQGGIPLSLLIEVSGMRANSDLDNHAKMVLDALQDAHVLRSDDVRTVRELIVRVVDGEPRTVVTITAHD